MKSGQLMRQVINKISEVDFNSLFERQHFGDIYEQLLNDLQNAGNAGEYYTPRAVTAFMVQQMDPKPGQILMDPACGTGGFLTCAMRHMREHYVKRPEDEATMQASLRAVEKKPLPHMLCTTNMLLHNVEEPSWVKHDNTLARPLISWTKDERVDMILTNPPFGGKEEDGIENNFPQFKTRETADLFLALIIRLLKKNGRAAVVLPDGSLFGEGIKTRLKEHMLTECNLHTIVRLPNSVFKPMPPSAPTCCSSKRARHAGGLVLGASRPRDAEGLFHDQADPAGASGRLRRMVGRAGARGARGKRARLEGLASTRSANAASTSTSRTPMWRTRTMATRRSC